MYEDYEPKTTVYSLIAREACDLIEAAMMAVVGVILVFTFVVRLAGVDGVSMLPTLADQDRLAITRMGGEPRQGDIVVVIMPNRVGEPLVKRVIAAGGQTIDIDFEAGIVLVDGTELHEPYISESTALSYDVYFPQTVPDGHVFIMGDNRNNSWDSRDSRIGMVDNRYILGRAIYRVFPYNRMGRLGVP